MIYWRDTIDWYDPYDYSEGERLCIQDETSFADFTEKFVSQTGLDEAFLLKVTGIRVSGCLIDTFSFLKTMPNLKKIYFLEDRSDSWDALRGTPKVEALSLHNLKSGKRYLDDTAFLLTFPNLRYLYLHMLGISSLPEAARLSCLYAVEISPRNENAVKEPFDFSSFGEAPALEIFDGVMAADRHRVPAESFIPILKNPSLRSFQYTQMYATEDKKLKALIKKYHPSLLETSLSGDEFLAILRKDFAL